MKQFEQDGLFVSIFDEDYSPQDLVSSIELFTKYPDTKGCTFYVGLTRPVYRVSREFEDAETARELADQPIFHKKKAINDERLALKAGKGAG